MYAVTESNIQLLHLLATENMKTKVNGTYLYGQYFFFDDFFNYSNRIFLIDTFPFLVVSIDVVVISKNISVLSYPHVISYRNRNVCQLT